MSSNNEESVPRRAWEYSKEGNPSHATPGSQEVDPN